jgi:hypothetical protein
LSPPRRARPPPPPPRDPNWKIPIRFYFLFLKPSLTLNTEKYDIFWSHVDYVLNFIDDLSLTLNIFKKLRLSDLFHV